VDAAAAAMSVDGFGASASRLICGSMTPHRALEAEVARWLGTGGALVFNSGYQANVGLVPALVGPGDVVFSDALNHASLIDGCRLSGARIEVYRHANPGDLEERLHRVNGRRRLIITDAIFSMDGDRAPISTLSGLAEKHGALLAVDEAHAIGVLGPNGSGLSQEAGVHLRTGTFGKALGGFGAFIAGDPLLLSLMSNRARSFVFTTALPVPVIAAARAALGWLCTPEGHSRREALAVRVRHFYEGLVDLGLGPPEPSHIVPLRVRDGGPRAAVDLAAALFARGLFVQPIRPPTVPAGTSRLRVALMATHEIAHLDTLLSALSELREALASEGN
jgi:8-amino-7-oxononanoate synthase